MKLFEDLPSQNTPINAEALNQIQDNLVVVSATEPTGDNREKVWMQKGKNLFNINTMVEFIGKHRVWDTGWFIAETGVYDGIKFPVKPNTNYAFSTDATEHLGVAFYDKNFDYISGQSFPNGTAFTTPENCYFVSMAVKNDYTWIQVEQGTTATEYKEYIEDKIYVLNENGLYEEFVSKNNLVNYSKEEQLIGTWIDGKPLYRKVLVFNNLSNLATYSFSLTDYFVDFDIDTLRIECWGKRSGFNQWVPAKDILLNGNEFSVGGFSWSGEVFAILDIKIIAEYTKTTD